MLRIGPRNACRIGKGIHALREVGICRNCPAQLGYRPADVAQPAHGAGRERARPAANQVEMPVSAKELREVALRPVFVVAERSAGRENSQLRMFRVQAEPVVQDPEDVRHLRARGPAVGVKFVNDQVEDVGAVGVEPSPGHVEDGALDVPHQHDVQHAVVGDQDVGRRLLHIEAAPHLAAVELGEEPLSLGARHAGGHAAQTSEFVSQIGFGALPSGSARNRRPPGVPAEPEAVAWAPRAQPGARSRSVQGKAQPRHLIFCQGVERIEHERPHGRQASALFMRALRKSRVMRAVS